MQRKLVALVTGGASGIGKATARKLASRGISVVIADVNKSAAEAVATEIGKDFDVQVRARGADVSDENAVKELVAYAVSLEGSLDYAANCAGICESVWDEEESISTEIFEK